LILSLFEQMKQLVQPKLYCNSLTSYSRYQTREVNVGGLIIGGNYPIRIQSMTTTDTMNTIATVEQSIRMIDAGCELVRITAPSINEARNLEEIKKELLKRGYKVPLVADIHFTPNAAEMAARIVEKVRVNPGNYADKKKFETIDYSDAQYDAELDRINERFTPLIKICKEYGTAMRIGTNHGSLSDRILSRYGDTPLGMVESAMEFLRICEDNNYFNIVLSMKASNAQVMVQAYRLLIMKMQEEEMNYPLHLGVTEAGDGEDGRIKSAAGIGTLLEDGIGDTVRVSLTEDPEFEIPVAKALVARYFKREKLQKPIPAIDISLPGNVSDILSYSPFDYSRRQTNQVHNIGGHKVPVVVADLSREKNITPSSLIPFGYKYSEKLDKWNLSDQACDYIFTGDRSLGFEIPGTLRKIRTTDFADRDSDIISQSLSSEVSSIRFVEIDIHKIFNATFLSEKKINENCVLVLTTSNEHGMAEQRRIFIELMRLNIKSPVIIKRSYAFSDHEELALNAATDIGALFLDGFGDGIWIDAPHCPPEKVNGISFGILQATRTRISKTEYISCPSCGRTLFDLQETTAKIRSRTSHLKGVKIGIMGCIVNGPGEMADADYGYVGTGVGKITLYKGREVMQRNIDSTLAVDALIELIKKNGDWVELA
jgi:(E)-4-hydroxy-3-methylbut-2-enyl-diphosphate synthase